MGIVSVLAQIFPQRWLRRVQWRRVVRLKFTVVCWMLIWLSVGPWRWRQYVLPKHGWTCTGLRGVNIPEVIFTYCTSPVWPWQESKQEPGVSTCSCYSVGKGKCWVRLHFPTLQRIQHFSSQACLYSPLQTWRNCAVLKGVSSLLLMNYVCLKQSNCDMKAPKLLNIALS